MYLYHSSFFPSRSPRLSQLILSLYPLQTLIRPLRTCLHPHPTSNHFPPLFRPLYSWRPRGPWRQVLNTTTPVTWDGEPLGDIRVRASETEEAVELSVAHTLPAGADVLLHWGIVPEGVKGWAAPDPSLYPSALSGARAPTELVGAYAVESKFPTAGGYELLLKFPKASASTSPAPAPRPDEVRFVVLRRDPKKGDMWLNQKCVACYSIRLHRNTSRL